MAEKRLDHKGRILLKGESQRKDGMYAYKYKNIHGEVKFVYSWKLNPTDKLPKGKRTYTSLRELEEQIQKDLLDGIDTTANKMTVCQLYEKHNNLNSDVRESTRKGRKRLMEILEEDKLGNMPISSVKVSDTKEWIKRMKKKGYAYQTIKNYKRSLNASFQMALVDDLIRVNPFCWKINGFIENDTKKKEVLTDEQVEKILDFVKNDEVYSKHYNAIVILLNTGLRISELCGLTENDIDFEKGYISVDHQLVYSDSEYRIEKPKTGSGVRKVPILPITRKALLDQIESVKGIKKFKVDGYSNFLFYNKKELPMYAGLYLKVFQNLIKKHNRMYKDDILPTFTPHLLRHTFCTNMAKNKMTPNCLQFIMGHKSITMTLGYYTHASIESVMSEMLSMVS